MTLLTVTQMLSLLALLPVAAVARADDPKQIARGIDKNMRDALTMIGDCRPQALRKLPRKLGDLERGFKRLAKVFRKTGNDEMERTMKRWAALFDKLERGAASDFVQLVSALERYRATVSAFEKEALKAQAEAFEPIDCLLDDLRAAARRVSAGREVPRSALESIQTWKRRGERALDEALQKLARQAADVFGSRSKDLKVLARLAQRARSGKGGSAEADLVVKAIEIKVKGIERQLDRLTSAFRTTYADLLAGPQAHRQALVRKKALAILMQALG